MFVFLAEAMWHLYSKADSFLKVARVLIVALDFRLYASYVRACLSSCAKDPRSIRRPQEVKAHVCSTMMDQIVRLAAMSSA